MIKFKDVIKFILLFPYNFSHFFIFLVSNSDSDSDSTVDDDRIEDKCNPLCMGGILIKPFVSNNRNRLI